MVYGHVVTKFSRMGRFTYPWCSAGALRTPELRYYLSYKYPRTDFPTLSYTSTREIPTVFYT